NSAPTPWPTCSRSHSARPAPKPDPPPPTNARHPAGVSLSPPHRTRTMPAQLIDGLALSRQLRADVAARVAALKARGITPGLAVILVGEDPASQVYVRNKVKA